MLIQPMIDKETDQSQSSWYILQPMIDKETDQSQSCWYILQPMIDKETDQSQSSWYICYYYHFLNTFAGELHVPMCIICQ